MKKIIFGVLGIVMTVAVVAGSAYALFSAQATVSGVSISAGSAGLQVASFDKVFTTNWNIPFAITGLYPGYSLAQNDTQAIDMWLKNTSNSVNLAVTMKITTLPTGWGNYLTYATQMLVKDELSGDTTGWKSLLQYANGEVTLPGDPIAHTTNNERRYFIYLRVPTEYGNDEGAYTGGPSLGTVVGNEISGLELTGSVITLTGTQVN